MAEEEVVGLGMVQDRVMVQAPGMARQVGLPVEYMLVEAVGVKVVEAAKMEDLATVQAPALGMVRLVGTGLMVERMLREVVKVVEEEVDKMVALVLVLVLVPVPGMVKQVGMGPMAEGTRRVVVKVEVVAVDKMVVLEVDLVLVLGMVKPVAMARMVVGMLKQVGKVVVEVVDSTVVLDKVPVLVLVMAKLVDMDLMVVDMLRLVVKAVVAVVGKVVQVAADMGMAQEVVLDLLVVALDTHKTLKLL